MSLIFMYDFVLFVLMYLLSFNLVFNGNDWFVIWLGLEINMMMFIVIVFKRYSMLNVESCFKYFFVQSLGSAVFVSLFYMNKEYLDFVLCLILSYKIGAGPFFFWFPSVCMGVSWMSCFVLMSFQKIIPLVLISVFVSWMFFFVVIISLVVGVFGSFNQQDLKRLMAYSSIYHLGWIFLCILINEKCWVNYMMMYMLMVFPVIYFFWFNNIINLLEIISFKNKMWMVILMLSMAGMPPFLGFFLKWFAFMEIMGVSIFYMMFLVICSVIMFYVYFRIIYDILLGYFSYGSWGEWFSKKEGNFFDMMCMVGMLIGLFFTMCLLF